MTQTNLDPNLTTPKSELTILWERGYLPEEHQGILQVVQEWQNISGKKVNFKLVSDEFIEKSLFQALTNPNSSIIPDIVFSIKFNTNIAPILAWQDKLLDLSEIIKPIESDFHADALSQVRYRNQVRNDYSYYALPIGLSDPYIHYWKDSLAKIGYDPSDIPKEWHLFWKFWQTAQTQVRSHDNSQIYGLGLCLSANGFDTSAAFNLFLDAHNVKIASQRDGLVLGDPQNRPQFIDVITQFTDFYNQGYVPPEALEWSGAGNNVAFLNQRVLMTVNNTLSIPRSQKLDDNRYNQNAAQRCQDMGTLATNPHKLDGTALYGTRMANQILAFKHDQNSKDVFDFLRYLLKPDHMRSLIGGFNGRILPAMPKLLTDPLWQDPSDQHTAAALTLYHVPRVPEEPELNLVLSQIDTQQLWAQILHKTIQANASPTEAADWGIAKIQTIWQELEN